MSHFAFAQIHGDICLVQRTSRIPDSTHGTRLTHAPVSAPASALLPAADVKVFRHEFITIFRYSHSTSVHPADLHVLHALDARCALYEEDKGTVFLARDAAAHLQKLVAMARGAPHPQRPQARRPARAVRVARLA